MEIIINKEPIESEMVHDSENTDYISSHITATSADDTLHQLMQLLDEFNVSYRTDKNSNTFAVDTADVITRKRQCHVDEEGGQVQAKEEKERNDVVYSRFINVSSSLISFLVENGVCCEIDEIERTCTINTVEDGSASHLDIRNQRRNNNPWRVEIKQRIHNLQR